MSHTATHSAPAALSATSNAELAALILRVSMGFLFLVHAWLKISVFTPAGTAAFFESIGFPGALAYVVIAAEVLGGIALILGTWTRWVSLALIPILLGSIYAPPWRGGLHLLEPGRRLGVSRVLGRSPGGAGPSR